MCIRDRPNPNSPFPFDHARPTQPAYPFPFDQYQPPSSANHYIETEDNPDNTFFVDEAVAEFDNSTCCFTLKKIPVDAEIQVDILPAKAQALFKGPEGSRGKEWQNMVNQVNKDGPAVIVHRLSLIHI